MKLLMAMHMVWVGIITSVSCFMQGTVFLNRCIAQVLLG